MVKFYGNVNGKECKSIEEFLDAARNCIKTGDVKQAVEYENNKNNISTTLDDIKRKNKNGGFNLWEMFFLLKNNDGFKARLIGDKNIIYYLLRGALIMENVNHNMTSHRVTIREQILNAKFEIILPEDQEEWVDCDVVEAIHKTKDGFKARYNYHNKGLLGREWHYFDNPNEFDLNYIILNDADWQYLKKD